MDRPDAWRSIPRNQALADCDARRSAGAGVAAGDHRCERRGRRQDTAAREVRPDGVDAGARGDSRRSQRAEGRRDLRHRCRRRHRSLRGRVELARPPEGDSRRAVRRARRNHPGSRGAERPELLPAVVHEQGQGPGCVEHDAREHRRPRRRPRHRRLALPPRSLGEDRRQPELHDEPRPPTTSTATGHTLPASPPPARTTPSGSRGSATRPRS